MVRNRSRSAASLEARLLKSAEEARAAANFIAPGPEQDQLLRKALKAETLASAADRLSLAEDLSMADFKSEAISDSRICAASRGQCHSRVALSAK